MRRLREVLSLAAITGAAALLLSGCAGTGAPLLVISQFTLYGDTRQGRRPSWSAAAPAPVAEPLVAEVVSVLRAPGQTGRFGAAMAVSSVNDGPFTVLVEV